MMKPFYAAVLCAGLVSCAATPDLNAYSVERIVVNQLTAEQKIRILLFYQQSAWNDGDIESFMQPYWKSPDLRFASGGSVTRGWQQTYDRYKARYKTKADMGELIFDQIEIVVLSDEAAVVHGAWALQRTADRPSGLFTLVWKKIEGIWVIVSDTTTSADQ